MKKQVKIFTTVLMVIMLIASLSSVALASGKAGDILKSLDGSSTVTTSGLVNFGNAIIAIIQTIGVVVAVVVLLVLGIKYMMGSAEEKAEYKKTMVPYVVGALLIFAATTIVNVVYQLATSANVAK